MSPSAKLRAGRSPRGFTLIEIMLVLAIVGAAMGVAVVSFRAVDRATARSNSSRLAAAIRYVYDRAVTTGGYYRIVLDLTANKYWAERSDDRFYLAREPEKSSRGRAPDEEAKEKKLKEDEDRAKQQVTGLAKELLPPPAPRRARFQAFTDSTLPKIDLKGCKLRDVLTRRQRDPYTEGKAYLYFFPDGHTERALIHIEDTNGDVYSLSVHPLTGRVTLKSGDVRAGRDFGETDDEGRSEAPR
ncbi:MAG: type II secretion system protein [Myxococcales bacterium]|nr:type II secretion system protein [Myxococcales bacterium]